MMDTSKTVLFSIIVVLCSLFILLNIRNEPLIQFYDEKSSSLIGVNVPRNLGFTGNNVKIGVIDTGIDYTHHDLLGFGNNGKVVGGYDFVDNDEQPMDTNGHGTEVAGIIASNGKLMGIAPNAKLFAYRVSADGESVSSDYIIKAIHKAIADKVNIINISLGENKTNDAIDNAVRDAVRNGIVVVIAAGNNGPALQTIGSPAKNPAAITVGASYNNITSSLVSTLEIGQKQYQVIPMRGTKALPESVYAKIIFGGYGRLQDLANLNVKDSILLVERGSDVPGEKIYFSEKEYNAALNGAKAVIVFNNEPGIFYGELIGRDNKTMYNPSIPVVSISRVDGLYIKETFQNEQLGKLNVFYHPDFVAPFSSRGPVSPFYPKPDLVAPGVFINSTLPGNKYNLTSGTSFAAPHVSGAAALLLERSPSLKPVEMASILSTTSDPVTDPYGKDFAVNVAGSGRLNVTRAFSANLVVIPHYLIFNLSQQDLYQTKSLQIESLNEQIPTLEINFSSEEKNVGFEYKLEKNFLNVKVFLRDEKLGDFEGVLKINDGKTLYHIPVLIHVTKGSIKLKENDGNVALELNYPDKWSYAKISLTNKETGEIKVASITPNKMSSISAHSSGEYWAEARIATPNGTDNAYGTITVKNPRYENELEFWESGVVPMRQILIISGIVAISILVGIARKRS